MQANKIMTDPRQQPGSPLLVTAAVIQQQDRTLITLRPEDKPHGGFWEFPGGKVHSREAPAAGLRRELLEELALSIKVEKILEALYHTYDWGSVLILAYQCSIIAGSPQNLEVAEHRWVPTKELHRYKILPADKPLIERLQAEAAQ